MGWQWLSLLRRLVFIFIIYWRRILCLGGDGGLATIVNLTLVADFMVVAAGFRLVPLHCLMITLLAHRRTLMLFNNTKIHNKLPGQNI